MSLLKVQPGSTRGDQPDFFYKKNTISITIMLGLTKLRTASILDA